MNTKLSRRQFLKSLSATGACALAAGMLPSSALNTAQALSPAGKRLVFLTLGGGLDYQDVFQPDIGALADIRPTIFRRDNFLSMGSTNIMLHPNLPIFKQLYETGEMAIIRRVGYDNPSRSHNDSAIAVARGVRDRGSAATTGWLNRLGATHFPDNPFPVIDLSAGEYVTTAGSYRGVVASNLSQIKFGLPYGVGEFDNSFRDATTESIIRDWPNIVQDAHALQLSYVDASNYAAVFGNLTPVVYENLPGLLPYSLSQVETAMQLPQSSIIVVSRNGLDSHGEQRALIDPILAEVNAALTRFISNLRASGEWQNTVLCINSEFGRTLYENQARGTDHGGATDFIVISPAVQGGHYGRPYEASDFVINGPEDNWIDHDINIVDVLSEVVESLGYNPAKVFEGTGSKVGFMKNV